MGQRIASRDKNKLTQSRSMCRYLNDAVRLAGRSRKKLLRPGLNAISPRRYIANDDASIGR